MKRIQRKRTRGWKMPPNTNKVISKERQTYNLCHGHEDEKKNTIASHVEDTPTENHCQIVPNQNTRNTIVQDAKETTPTDEKGEPKQGSKEQHTEMKNPKPERKGTNEISQPSKSVFLKDSEGDVRGVDSPTKEHSKSTISTAEVAKNGNDLAGNTSRQFHDSQTKNSGLNTNVSVPTATKSRNMNDAKPVRIQRKRTRGFNLQKASPNGLPVVYVGRPSKWGNPYAIQPRGQFTREQAIETYGNYVKRVLVDRPDFLDPLKGKDLACWCRLDKPCHADVLLKFLEETKGE